MNALRDHQEPNLREGMFEQLHMTFDGFVEAMSLRLAGALGADQSLNEVVDEIVAEMSARGNRR